MKKIACFIPAVILFITVAKTQNSGAVNERIAVFQKQLLLAIEKQMPELYPHGGYYERFFYFKIDSTGSQVSDYRFVDANGHNDSLLSKIVTKNFIFNWKDTFSPEVSLNNYIFFQPILIAKREMPFYEISNIPFGFFLKKELSLHYMICLKQISTSVGLYK